MPSFQKNTIIGHLRLWRQSRRSCRAMQGFTLIEIMVVVMILGLLAALIVPKVMGRADDARHQAALQNIASLTQALRLYKLDNFNYPSTEQGLRSLVSKPTVGTLPNNYRAEGYVDKLPKDPWGNDYVYLYPGRRGEFDLYSLGADGVPDVEGKGDDVAPWKTP